MKDTLAEKCYQALKVSQYWTDKTKENDKTIQNLICPQCGDKSAWAYRSEPFAIVCNKNNTCGSRTKVKELLSVSIDFEKENPPTQTDKHRPAEAYLKSRGLDKALTNLTFEYWPKVRGTKSGAVLFPLQTPNTKKKVMNGRLFNPPSGEGKTHNTGSTSGCFWMHPGFDYDPKETTYICEAIIDALSLAEASFQTIAILSSNTDPHSISLPPLGNLVIALDGDEAGKRGLRKWKKAYPDIDAILPPEGKDWNDLLRDAGNGEKLKQRFEKSYQLYQTNANLALAANAIQYASIFHNHYGYAPGLFEHKGFSYYSHLKKKGDEKQLHTECIGEFTIKVMSILDEGDANESTYYYNLQIIKPGEKPEKCIAAADDIATVRNLKTFLIKKANAAYTGNNLSNDALLEKITTSRVPKVRKAKVLGYDTLSNWYIFGEYAIDPNGQLHQKEKAGYFKVAHNQCIAPADHSSDKAIVPCFDSDLSPNHLYELVYKAWGSRGIVALSWVIGSLFINQVKDVTNAYPHFSISGEPASGKTALTNLLHFLQGLDDDGVNLSAGSTKKGYSRRAHRLSGLACAYLEYVEGSKALDFLNILTAFNRSSTIQAKFSQNLQTIEHPMQCSLMFVQNHFPFKKQEEKERFISLTFSTSDLTAESKTAYDEISRIGKADIASIMVKVLSNRKIFEENWHQEFIIASADLQTINHSRINLTFSLVLAFHRLFCKAFKIDGCIFEYIEYKAKATMISTKERDYTLADRFFESINDIEDDNAVSCIHLDLDSEKLFINLTGAEVQLRRIGHQTFANDVLIQSLREHPAFLSSSKLFRFPLDPEKGHDNKRKQRRVWIFDYAKIEAEEFEVDTENMQSAVTPVTPAVTP